MQRLLIIGCGDIARRALPSLVKHYRVYAAVRSDARHRELRAMGVTPLRADLDKPHTLKRLAGIGNLILHFAPPQETGRQDKRTRALLAALSTGKILPCRLVYISTSGVYGDCRGAWVSEERPLQPQTPRALRRADAEARLRRFGRARRVAVSILRAPGIYAGGRLPLVHILVPCEVSDTTKVVSTRDCRWAGFSGGLDGIADRSSAHEPQADSRKSVPSQHPG